MAALLPRTHKGMHEGHDVMRSPLWPLCMTWWSLWLKKYDAISQSLKLIFSTNLSTYLCYMIRYRLYFLTLPVLFFAAACSNASGGEDSDSVNQGPGVPDPCVLVPAKTMNADATDSVLEADFGQLISCGLLEQFDVNYLVPNLIPEVMADAAIAGKDSITYQMIIDRLRRFKMTDDYKLVRGRMRLLDSLRTLPVNLSDWKADTALLSGLGMNKSEQAVLRKTAEELLKKNPNLLWEALLDSTDARLQHDEYAPD